MFVKIKAALKSNRLLTLLNADVKAYLQKRKYTETLRYYAGLKVSSTLDAMMLERGLNATWANSLSNKKVSIFFVGTDYNQDHGGFIQALSKASDLRLFTRQNGEYGQYNPFDTYNGILGRQLNTETFVATMDELNSKNELPDIVLTQSLGSSFFVSDILSVKQKYGFKLFNICLDDRLVFKQKTPPSEKYDFGSSGLIPLIDLALVANSDVVDWYLKENVPAIFFPMASSEEVYYPIKCSKKYDVGFIGSNYGYRGKLISSLKRAGLDVHARGVGWPEGKLALDENNLFMNQCKIVLGIGTVGHSRDFYTSKLRDFEAPLSGAVYVTHNNPDLWVHYDEGDLVLCNTEEGFVKSIQALLADEEKMDVIRSRAYNKARKFHTYEHRFQYLFHVLGISQEESVREG